MKQHQKSLFIFRRDLRIYDNRGLLRALHESKEVVPCFIFDPNPNRQQKSLSQHEAIQFMLESLQELDEQLTKGRAAISVLWRLS